MKNLAGIACFLVVWFLASSSVYAGVNDIEHPFLITRENLYSDLRARSAESPWSEMKDEAILVCTNQTYVYNFGSSQFEIGDILGACSLAYILDTENQGVHYNRIKNLLGYWPQIDVDQESGDWWAYWERFTPQTSAFFESTLALDIIRDQYLLEDSVGLAEVESAMGSVYERYKALSTGGGWVPAREGLITMWELYTDDRTEFLESKEAYKQVLKTQMSEDGVFYEGAGYAYNRMGTDWRPAKHGVMDVLYFTGEDTSFYSDPTIKGFYEWFYGYSATTFDTHYTFGDSGAFGGFRINDNRVRESFAVAKAMNISDEAGSYASHRNEGMPLRGRIMNYVLMDVELPEPQSAPSRIFSKGGAYFREINADANSLQAVLWNNTGFDWHSHKDTNSIYFAGYGEPLLMNAGFAGAGGDYQGFAWDYLNNRAVSSNAALIDYEVGVETNPSSVNDHVAKFGEGISEGFVTSTLDYASGDSGGALSNGQHQRDMIFMHPTGEANGYLALFDQVQASTSGSMVNLAFHPNSDEINTVTSLSEYAVEVGHFAGGTMSNNNVGMSMHFVTEPESVATYNGAIADWATAVAPPAPGPRIGGYIAKYLLNDYETDQNGYAQILSVFYPYDNTHVEPNISRIGSGVANGLKIDHSEAVVDYHWENRGGGSVLYEGMTHTADYGMYRLVNDLTRSVYLKNGTEFVNLNQGDLGISASTPVTLYLYDLVGKIVTNGTVVIEFTFPGIEEIKVDGVVITPVVSTIDTITVEITDGVHDLEIVAEGTPTPTPIVTPTPQLSTTPTPTPVLSPTITPTPSATPTVVPGGAMRIEVESFDRSSGNISVVYTGDNKPNQKVNLIAPGMWTEYDVLVPSTGTYAFSVRSSSANSSTLKTLELLVDGDYVTMFQLPYTQYWEEFENTTQGGIYLTAGLHTIRINFTSQMYDVNFFELAYSPGVTPLPTVTSTPMPTATVTIAPTVTPTPTAVATSTPSPTPTLVPGGPVRIEAEAFVDSSGDISVVYTGDNRPNQKVNFNQLGKWTEYAVNIGSAGDYDLSARTSSPNSLYKEFQVRIDGGTPIVFHPPFTGYWEEFFTTSVQENVYLSAGNHTIRVDIMTGGFDFNFLELVPVE